MNSQSQLPVVVNINITSALPTGHVETAVLLMRDAGKEKKEINYGEEEIPDCACIYG